MSKTFHTLFVLWLIIACSIGSPQPCAADTLVTLRGEVQMKRTVVKLSDVFDGVPASVDADIAQAPAPGKQVTYDSTVLNRLAQKYHLSWEPQSTTDHVVLTSASTRITADIIREAVIKRVKENNPLPKGGEVDVAFDNHTLQVDLPADRGNDFVLNNFDYDSTSKHFRTDLVADGAGGPFSVPVTGRIVLKRSVPTLAHRVEGGSTLSAADLDITVVPEDRINGAVVTDISQLVGRELRRDTDEGDARVGRRHLTQARSFRVAERAPRRPEPQHRRLTLQAGPTEGSTAEGCSGELQTLVGRRRARRIGEAKDQDGREDCRHKYSERREQAKHGAP